MRGSAIEKGGRDLAVVAQILLGVMHPDSGRVQLLGINASGEGRPSSPKPLRMDSTEVRVRMGLRQALELGEGALQCLRINCGRLIRLWLQVPEALTPPPPCRRAWLRR